MTYLISLSQTIECTVTTREKLSPHSWLYCKDEEELRSEIREYLSSYCNINILEINDVIKEDLDLPKEFIDEWNKLKKLSQAL